MAPPLSPLLSLPLFLLFDPSFSFFFRFFLRDEDKIFRYNHNVVDVAGEKETTLKKRSEGK
jgi:hypothetical protein